jgi:8-oxo-dGTP diphosphatase
MNQDLIRAAGGVVVATGRDGRPRILLIQDRYGVWTLPKGHLDPGESEEQAAVREILEETGVPVTLDRPLTRARYPVCKRGVWRDKEVAYFLASAPLVEPSPAADEGIAAARWLTPAEALALIAYAQVRDVVRAALSALSA